MIERVYKAPVKILSALCLLFQLVACGGGGGGSSTSVSNSSNQGQAIPPVPSPPTNSAPTLSGISATSVTVGSAYSFQPTAIDSDGDSLVFSVQNPPVWASFNTSTGRLSGTPTASDIGNPGGIIITVSDGLASAATAPFSIRVYQDQTLPPIPAPATNSAPTLSGSPAASITVGSVYSFQPTAVDTDGDSLVFSIQNRPVWASFNASTGRLSGTPTTSDIGAVSAIAISVSDGAVSASIAPFSIRVDAAPKTNSAPTLSGSPAVSVTVGSVYTFQPTAVDSDGDSLVFSIQNVPVWASFNTSTGRLSGTPTASDIGTVSAIAISVSDGAASASIAPFSIRVDAAIPSPVPAARKFHPGHYVAMEHATNDTFLGVIKPGVVGLQVRYTWNSLEPSLGNYDFTKIQADLNVLSAQGMKLVVFLEDKSFAGDPPPTPLYLQGATYTQGNIAGGYSAVRWDPYVLARYKALIKRLGKRFDGNPAFEGIAFQESAVGFDNLTLSATGYTPEMYRDSLTDTLLTAASSFPTSQVFWFMNFLSEKQAYIADIANAVAPAGVAMGGPDVLPEDASLVRITYPFYDEFKNKMTLFGSMQNDSYRELHSDTTYPTKYWTMDEMFLFARDQLHVKYIFWNHKTWPAANPAGENTWADALPVIANNSTFNP